MTPKYTLDTSCIIAAVSGEPEAAHIDELVQLAREGHVELFLTHAYHGDQSLAPEERRGQNLEWLTRQPIVTGVPELFRFSRPGAGFDDGVFASDAAGQVDGVLRELLNVDSAKDVYRKTHDVAHLSSHYQAGHDVFVTKDADDMVKKRKQIRERTAIRILTPAEAVAELKNQAGQ